MGLQDELDEPETRPLLTSVRSRKKGDSRGLGGSSRAGREGGTACERERYDRVRIRIEFDCRPSSWVSFLCRAGVAHIPPLGPAGACLFECSSTGPAAARFRAALPSKWGMQMDAGHSARAHDGGKESCEEEGWRSSNEAQRASQHKVSRTQADPPGPCYFYDRQLF